MIPEGRLTTAEAKNHIGERVLFDAEFNNGTRVGAIVAVGDGVVVIEGLGMNMWCHPSRLELFEEETP